MAVGLFLNKVVYIVSMEPDPVFCDNKRAMLCIYCVPAAKGLQNNQNVIGFFSKLNCKYKYA